MCTAFQHLTSSLFVQPCTWSMVHVCSVALSGQQYTRTIKNLLSNGTALQILYVLCCPISVCRKHGFGQQLIFVHAVQCMLLYLSTQQAVLHVRQHCVTWPQQQEGPTLWRVSWAAALLYTSKCMAAAVAGNTRSLGLRGYTTQSWPRLL
jgi:hypothetical protein